MKQFIVLRQIRQEETVLVNTAFLLSATRMGSYTQVNIVRYGASENTGNILTYNVVETPAAIQRLIEYQA